MKKEETKYTAQLEASEYDFLEVIQSAHDNRITIKMLDTHWRTKEQTIAVLKEIITQLETL